jgi:two-component system OmpR family response regulator
MNRLETLLVVDDDRDIRTLLSERLESDGYAVVQAADGKDMRRALTDQAVDLVILDLNLPGEDGLTLCRDLRAKSAVPVIMLTARGEAIDRIVGLEMGADDYLAKPFEPRELLARIRSVLRRTRALPTNMEPISDRRVRFAGWILDRERRLLTSPDQRLISLSSAEFDLLDVLAAHSGRVLSREQLRTLAAGPDTDDRAIDLRVSRLRQKLGDDARSPELIKTVRNLGYVLAAPVSQTDEADQGFRPRPVS